LVTTGTICLTRTVYERPLNASTPIAAGERLTGNRTADGFEQAREGVRFVHLA